MKPLPITYVWTGFAMQPLPRFANYAKRLFGEPGTEHTLEPTSVRNMASHNHYYAALTEAYNNLADEQRAKYPTLDHFRYRLLITAGFCEPDDVRVYANAKEAHAAAGKDRSRERFAVISIHDNVVVKRFAKSQDLSSMKREEFEASKNAVLELASEMVGITPSQLKQNAGRSA